MGWKGSDTRSIFFDNMEISSSNILGNIQKGFNQFLATLTGGRITIAALSLGIAQGAYDAALKYSHEREAFGKKIMALISKKVLNIIKSQDLITKPF